MDFLLKVRKNFGPAIRPIEVTKKAVPILDTKLKFDASALLYSEMVCPPTSMYAAYNVIPAPKELHLYLDSGHWIYPEQAKASNKWLKEHCGIR